MLKIRVASILASLVTAMVLAIYAQSPSGTIANTVHSSLIHGTYRPNLYFGTRSLYPHGPRTGLMWFGCNDYSAFNELRHSAEQTEKLPHGYTRHDGRHYAYQEIKDERHNVLLSTEFVKHSSVGDKWTVRIKGVPIDNAAPSYTAIMYYIALEDDGVHMTVDQSNTKSSTGPPITIAKGHSNKQKPFTFTFRHASNNSYPWPASVSGSLLDWSKHTAFTGFHATKGSTWRAKDYYSNIVMQQIQKISQEFKSKPQPAHIYNLNNKLATEDDDEDIDYEPVIVDETQSVSDVPEQHSEEKFTALAKHLHTAFEKRFEDTFQLTQRGFSDAKVEFARYAFSNLIGSIGYFDGPSLIDTTKVDEWKLFNDLYYYDDMEHSEEEWEEIQYQQNLERERTKRQNIRQTPAMELLACAPSRTFFPRGFFWDEGFHQLIIGAWDNDLSLHMFRSWFNLMDDAGWIAREQILGDEARSRVPEGFQVQYPHHANPPALLYAIESFLNRLDSNRMEQSMPNFENSFSLFSDSNSAFTLNTIASTQDLNYLVNYYILNTTAAHESLNVLYDQIKKNYNWFRKSQIGIMDDFDRDPQDNNNEGYRWRGRSVNHTFASGLDDYPRSNPPHVGELHLDLLSWMGFYTRVLHRIAVLLEKSDDAAIFAQRVNSIKHNLIAFYWDKEETCFADITVNDRERSIHSIHKGYITLFPFLMGLVDVQSDQLGATLRFIRDEDELWSPYGIRSLSKQDRNYGQGENYWKGPIWINVNYMVLSALHHHYTKVPGPHQALAQKVYQELRDILITTIYEDYAHTNFLWEQYSPETGKGQRSHPFTGWTSLVVLIMAEKY